jgi:beta-fructofuranosidase
VLSLSEDGFLRIEPAEELDALRFNHRRLDGVKVGPDAEVALDSVNGDSMELRMVIDAKSKARFGVKVRCSPDGREETAIGYDPRRGLLSIDLHKSSLDSKPMYRTFCFTPDDYDDWRAAKQLRPTPRNPPVTAQEAPFELQPSERLDLRVYIDRSMLEVFANGRQCLTQRIYPMLDESLGVRLFSTGDAVIAAVDAWDMAETVFD